MKNPSIPTSQPSVFLSLPVLARFCCPEPPVAHFSAAVILSLSLSHWEGFILRYSVNHVCVRGSDPYPLRHYKIENYARRGMRSVKNGMDWLRHREASGVCVLPATFVFSSCGTTNTHNHFQI